MISPAPISTLRLILRIANAFSLELLGVYRGERDFADGLILAALMQRKSAPLSAAPEQQRLHAAFDAPIPEHLRGAISINALATSLGLPFETVRRRTEGIRISASLPAADGHRADLQAVYDMVRSLYFRLARANCIQPMELPPPAPGVALEGEPPVRIVWRASADYFLRVMELLLPHFSHLMQAFILQEVARANTAGLPDSMRGDDRMHVDALVPDAYRIPVRATQVAKRLAAPHETVRRNLAGLVEDGRCQAVSGGFIVPAAVLAQGNLAAAYAPNFQNLRRMFTALAEAGVLARWERERQAAESAA